MAYVFCNQCGHRNPPESSFCSACGATLDHTGEHTAAIARTDVTDPTLLSGEGLVETADVAPGNGVLVVRGGAQNGLRFALLDRVTSLGRSVENDVSLDDITVSRRHAVVERNGERFTVHDNGSLNGTYVNGRRITMADLAHGDELQVGKFHFLFLLGSE
jgi:pSer/pThr/pTyr-binding forkhead associated (FHA) protein